MPLEPITLFSRIADPALVARRLRELVPGVKIDGPDDSWRNAVITFGKLWKKRTLTFTHDPDYYAEPDWSVQMDGMCGYLSRLQVTERKERALLLPTSFHFSLGTLVDPEMESDKDPRLEIIYAVAELLDGVLFTPSSLRDARGRVLFGAGGEDEEDPDAVWPNVIAEVTIDDPRKAATGETAQPNSLEDEADHADPPTAERVARRALALKAVTKRAILEQDPTNPDASRVYKDLLGWVGDIGIRDELEPDEWEVLQRPLGRLDQQMTINSTWRLEGLAVLAWALGRFEVPPHDQLVTVNPLWRSLGLLNVAGAKDLLKKPALRSRKEIAIFRNRMFALHWRLRNYNLNAKVLDFVEFARSCWFGPLDISGFPLNDGDLAIRGERLDRADPDAFSAAHSAAQERHQAVNWLWEGPVKYSEASLAT